MRLVYYLARLIRRWGDPAFPKLSFWLTGERLLASRQRLLLRLN